MSADLVSVFNQIWNVFLFFYASVLLCYRFSIRCLLAATNCLTWRNIIVAAVVVVVVVVVVAVAVVVVVVVAAVVVVVVAVAVIVVVVVVVLLIR